MQCSDISSIISGILILQYVLKMRNTTFLGLESPRKYLTVAPAVNKSGLSLLSGDSSADQWRSTMLVPDLM